MEARSGLGAYWPPCQNVSTLHQQMQSLLLELRNGGKILDEYLQKLETLQTSVENKTCTLEQVWQLIESPFLTNDVTSLELQQEKLIDEPQWDKSYFFECCATLKEHLLRLKINSNTQTSQNVQISTTLSEVSDHYLTAHKTNIEKSQSPKWLFFNNFTPEGDSLH